MALDLPAEECFSVFDADFEETEKAGLGSLIYWKHFAQIRATGYGQCAEYFEPKLKESEEMLEYLEPYESKRWIRAVRLQLNKEMALLHQIQTYRDAYGVMAVRLKAYENQKSPEFKEWADIRSELKAAEEEVTEIQQRQKETELKLEESYKKIDDLISLNFSVSDIDNEVKQTRKMASKYDDDFQLMEFEGKMLKKKSKTAAERYQQIEKENVDMILKTWKDALVQIDNSYNSYRSVIKANKYGAPIVTRIDSDFIVNKRMGQIHKDMCLYKFQNSDDIIKRNHPCRKYFRKTEARHLKELQDKKQNESEICLAEETEEAEQLLSDTTLSDAQKMEEETSLKKKKPSNKDKDVIKSDVPPKVKSWLSGLVYYDRPSTSKEGRTEINEQKQQWATGKKEQQKTSAKVENEEIPKTRTKCKKMIEPQRSTRHPEYIPTKTFSYYKGTIYISIPFNPKCDCEDCKVEKEEKRKLKEEKKLLQKFKPPRPESPPQIKAKDTWQSWSEYDSDFIRERLVPPYKVNIKHDYEKERKCEMSVKKGDHVEIISYPDNLGQVKAKKTTGKIFTFLKKTGWIPLQTFY